MRNSVHFFVLVSVLSFRPLLPEFAIAQGTQAGLAPTYPSASAASYYYISKPGELTMQVNVWGYVEKPGRYEVPTSTDLVQLISFAGGPSRDAKLDDVKVTRFVKGDGAIRREEFTVNLEELHDVQPGRLTLYPGDTVFMDHTAWVSLRDVFPVVTTAAVITSAVATIMWASRGTR